MPNSLTASLRRPRATDPGFDPAEFRRLIAAGRATGLVRDGGGRDTSADAMLRAEWIDVTPEIASEWLSRNQGNRSLREGLVRAFARELNAGMWALTHQGVAFDQRGILLDGQHRLEAIVRTGKTVRMLATFGLPEKVDGMDLFTRDAIDRGQGRTVADQLRLQHGIAQAPAVAMISASLAGLCMGERVRRLGVGHTLAVYRAFEKQVEWVVEARSREKGLRRAGVLAAFAFAAAAAGLRNGPKPGQVEAMLDALNAGTGARARSGIACLRDFLLAPESVLLGRTADRGISEVCLEAISLEMRGARVSRLAHSVEAANRFRFLLVDRIAPLVALFDNESGDRPRRKKK